MGCLYLALLDSCTGLPAACVPAPDGPLETCQHVQTSCQCERLLQMMMVRERPPRLAHLHRA